MAELETVQRHIRELEGIPVRDRSDAQNILLAGYLTEEARLAGTNWLFSICGLYLVNLFHRRANFYFVLLLNDLVLRRFIY